MELVNRNNEVSEYSNEIGEIVATGLNNYVMPLIRYRTQDLAKISPPSCECGRKYPLITKIEGRLQDLVVGKDGRLMSLTAVLAAIKRLEGFPQIKKIQFLQEEPGCLVASIVKGPGYSLEDERDIIQNVEKTFGDILSLEIQYVDEIPPTHTGKHRALIQKLSTDIGDYDG